ncbi:hypothetical protein N7450_008316 [Penicillium hetheringtonii]|uniref:Uncharacterized protein n=1 Tax=Penicillium hetheringtonii TaxID=911720 RepID=A0AAD6DCW1_9EURO|nr:hypothetical protein N7450_008316 [Penicillium hetheringtonii]
METCNNINIRTGTPSMGVFQSRPLATLAASKVSDLLQSNHDNHHIYIHNFGLHNHILHHLLALYPLGANPQQLDDAYNFAIASQRPTRPPNTRFVSDLANPIKFRECLGDEKHYEDFFMFFQKEIATKGLHDTIYQYLFNGDEIAEYMLRRFFSGFLHSPIHLGYAIEFSQPLVVAEALALTAIHDSEFGETLAMAEVIAKQSPESKGLVELQQMIYTNSKLRSAMRYEHGSFQIRDGLLANAKDEFLHTLGLWKVKPDDLNEKTAESLNSTIYWTTLAQRPRKQIRFDFFLMHSITAGSLWPALNSASWISSETKCRLLEWKGRSDLMLYCQSRAPQLHPQELISYRPNFPSGWPDIFQRACVYRDDGHLAKFIRAIATANDNIRPFARNRRFKIKSEQEFLTIAHMGMFV